MAELLLFLVLLSTTISSSAGDATSFVYAACSQPNYTTGSAYQFNVDSLLSSLTNAAAFSHYAKFTSSAASPSSPVYGLFQCRGDLSAPSCESCVRSALSQLSPHCPSASGAAVQLDACFIRYDNEFFLGKQDTTLLCKKCGPIPSNGYDADLMAMRDDALAALAPAGGTGGMYQVGAAGNVQAAAQCVGDLSAMDCSDCVTAAVGQLKGVCGFAVCVEVYLGKCFAKYCPNPSPSPSPSDESGKVSGKTLEITIGTVTGGVTITATVTITVTVIYSRRKDDDCECSD